MQPISVTYPFTYSPTIDGFDLFEQDMKAVIDTCNRSTPGWKVVGLMIEGTSRTSNNKVCHQWVELKDEPGQERHLFRAIAAYLALDHATQIKDLIASERPTKAQRYADYMHDMGR